MAPWPAQLARFLLTWLAAFLIVVALFSAFGQQLKVMSLQLRALTVPLLWSRHPVGRAQPQMIGPRIPLT